MKLPRQANMRWHIGIPGKNAWATSYYGVTTNVHCVLAPASDAVKITFVLEPTAVVVTVTVALAVPAGKNTDAGNDAKELLLESDTVTPPTGAVPFSRMVAVLLVPPCTEGGVEIKPRSGETSRVF